MVQVEIKKNINKRSEQAGYSKKTAHVIGQENLKKPAIKERIEGHRKKLSDKTDITIERVLKEYEKIAFAKTTKNSVVKVKDKIAALSDVGKHLGFFEKHQSQIGLSIVDIMAQAGMINARS